MEPIINTSCSYAISNIVIMKVFVSELYTYWLNPGIFR